MAAQWGNGLGCPKIVLQLCIAFKTASMHYSALNCSAAPRLHCICASVHLCICATVCNYAKEYKWPTCTRLLLSCATLNWTRVTCSSQSFNQSRGVVLHIILSAGSQSSAAVLQRGDIWSRSKFRTWTQTKWAQQGLRLGKCFRSMSNWCQAGSCQSAESN